MPGEKDETAGTDAAFVLRAPAPAATSRFSSCHPSPNSRNSAGGSGSTLCEADASRSPSSNVCASACPPSSEHVLGLSLPARGHPEEPVHRGAASSDSSSIVVFEINGCRGLRRGPPRPDILLPARMQTSPPRRTSCSSISSRRRFQRFCVTAYENTLLHCDIRLDRRRLRFRLPIPGAATSDSPGSNPLPSQTSGVSISEGGLKGWRRDEPVQPRLQASASLPLPQERRHICAATPREEQTVQER